VYVKDVVDLSELDGIGFLLSDGSRGFCFNDHSQLIVPGDGPHLFYLEQEKNLGGGTLKFKRCKYQLSNFPV